MDNYSASDLLSCLPESIIESILSLLPLGDAIRTSVLSTKWRYRWASLPQFVFYDKFVKFSPDKGILQSRVIKFISHALLLHNGPIHKFKVYSSVLQNCADIDQWILFVSRNDVRELSLDLGEGEWFRIPSSLFSCKSLTHLELSRCELDPPPRFQGFLCLRTLNLQQVSVAPEVIESLISSCPLLENLTLIYYDGLDLNIHAPNLKYLCLEGEFKDLCLHDTPLLQVICITLYMNTDEIQEHLEHSSGCNFVKFFGCVPDLQKLSGHVYFTKYLSIGIDQWQPPLTYSRLKVVELYQVSFEDVKEILVVLRLIISSPSLEDLHISGSPNTMISQEAPNLEFWETECPSNCTFKRLKVVKMTDMYGVPHELALIKFLLRSSPTLEKMSVTPGMYLIEGARLDMLVELVRFQRASPVAEIMFIQE